MIGNQIESNDCPCEVYANLDWIISEDTIIRPDLMVVCGRQPERHLERPPSLAVEVLSDSTRRRDLSAKRILCRENGVPHYLIIDPDERKIEHVTPSDSNAFDSHQTIQLQFDSGCVVQIDCSRLFD
jgi:Uma2 family endonuclease